MLAVKSEFNNRWWSLFNENLDKVTGKLDSLKSKEEKLKSSTSKWYFPQEHLHSIIISGIKHRTLLKRKLVFESCEQIPRLAARNFNYKKLRAQQLKLV